MQLQTGYYIFMFFAFLQVVPWVCDIIENIYLLNKITEGVKETGRKKHKALLLMEVTKWGIALTATVCSLSAICYFWLTGQYSPTSFWYLVLILVEIALFLLFKKILIKKDS